MNKNDYVYVNKIDNINNNNNVNTYVDICLRAFRHTHTHSHSLTNTPVCIYVRVYTRAHYTHISILGDIIYGPNVRLFSCTFQILLAIFCLYVCSLQFCWSQSEENIQVFLFCQTSSVNGNLVTLYTWFTRMAVSTFCIDGTAV